MQKSDWKKLTTPAAIAGACIGAATYLAAQNTWIEVEHIKVIGQEIMEGQGFRVVHLSDLHLPKTAGRIDKLVKLVRKQNPDIIVMTGDLIHHSAKLESCGLARLCQRLREIAPVYAVTGNHEFRNGQVEFWKELLRRNGVAVVDDTYAIWEKDGLQIAVMGLSNGMPYDMNLFENIEDIEGMPKILLTHHTEIFDTYATEADEVRPNVIFAGHAHGGQVRLPFVGGLLAPNQGFFPRFTNGMYQSENGALMIVSRGIGNSEFPFRINNRPHLPVVTFFCGK